MKYLSQFLYILLFSLLGELLEAVIPLPIPAAIYGLLLLLLALMTGAVLTQSGDTETYSVRLQTQWVSEMGAPTGDTGTKQININTADPKELRTLPGIGPALAQAIVEERQTNGTFRVPEEILRVPGIGPGKWKEIQNYIAVE
jgi:competence ComEA-like helix-hairpin-helix protein